MLSVFRVGVVIVLVVWMLWVNWNICSVDWVLGVRILLMVFGL